MTLEENATVALRDAVEEAVGMRVEWGVIAGGAASVAAKELGVRLQWEEPELHGWCADQDGRWLEVRHMLWGQLPMKLTGSARVVVEYGDAESRRAAWMTCGPTWWAIEIDMFPTQARDAAHSVRDMGQRASVAELLAGGMFGSQVRVRRVLRPGRSLRGEWWMASGMGVAEELVQGTTLQPGGRWGGAAQGASHARDSRGIAP